MTSSASNRFATTGRGNLAGMKANTTPAVHTPGQPLWYLVQCRPRQEQRALENLQNQHFDCFLPCIDLEKIRQGKRQNQREPLFPGYLFIRLHDTDQDWGSIRSTRGVRQLVRFGGTPAQVPQTIIDNLQQKTAQGLHKPALLSGDPVRIDCGPFARLDAIFQRFDGNERVIVLLDMLQKQHQLTLKLSDVSPQ